MRKSLLVVGIITVIGVATVVTLTNTLDNKVTETNKATETTSVTETSVGDVDLAIIETTSAEETTMQETTTVEATTKVTETTEAIVETATVQETTIVQETTTTIQETTTEVPTTTEPTTEAPTEVETTTEAPTEPPKPVYTFTEFIKEMYLTADTEAKDIDGNVLGTLNRFEVVEVTGACNETGDYRVNTSWGTSYVPANCLADTIKIKEEYKSQYVTEDMIKVQGIGASEEDIQLVEDFLYNQMPLQAVINLVNFREDKGLEGVSAVEMDKDGNALVIDNKVTISIMGYMFEEGTLGSASNRGFIQITNAGTTHTFDEYAKFTVVHELGHLTSYYDYSNHKEEFVNSGIYTRERNSYIEPTMSYTSNTKYHISTVGEFYAAIYTSYIFEPQSLRDLCPESYEYLQNKIGLYE